MLLDSYNEKGLLSITSVLGATSAGDQCAFRGDLVLKEGEFREGSSKDRKLPEFFFHQSVVLASEDKLLFVSGLLYELDKLALFIDKYKADLSAETVIVLFVENIAEKLKVELDGFTFQLFPYTEGMIWNELLELLYLEKSDLKGQSAEDKVVTLYKEACDLDIKTEVITFDEALQKTVVVEKEAAVGPV